MSPQENWVIIAELGIDHDDRLVIQGWAIKVIMKFKAAMCNSFWKDTILDWEIDKVLNIYISKFLSKFEIAQNDNPLESTANCLQVLFVGMHKSRVCHQMTKIEYFLKKIVSIDSK